MLDDTICTDCQYNYFVNYFIRMVLFLLTTMRVPYKALFLYNFFIDKYHHVTYQSGQPSWGLGACPQIGRRP